MTFAIDVIVPCYRYGNFLEECVSSILSQNHVDVRVLVLDDASPDNTQEIGTALARSDKRVTFRRHIENKGHIATYNEGIEWAEAELVLLLSADDYLLPGALSRAARIMGERPGTGFVFGNGKVLHENGSMSEDHPLGDEPQLEHASAMSGTSFIARYGSNNIVPAPTAVVRTALQKRLGGYRPELPHSGDLEMWLRLAAHSDVGFVDDLQAVYRRHERNMSIAYSRDYMLPDMKEKALAFEFFLQSCGSILPNPAGTRKRLFRSLSEQALTRASIAFNQGDRDAMETIIRFALDACPDIRMSLPWAKLSAKRALGSSGWTSLHPIWRMLSGYRAG